MRSSLILRLSLAALVILAAPALFAGPVGAPPTGVERFITYWDCSTGTPQYIGYEQWDCDGQYYHGGTINTGRAVVSDSDCETYEGDMTYYCKLFNGTWTQISQTWFDSCHVCTTIGG